MASTIRPVIQKLIPNEKGALKRRLLKNGSKKITVKIMKNQVKQMHMMTNYANVQHITPKVGAIAIIRQNIISNGFRGLYGGITAGLQRQVAFCAVRIGCYDSIKNFYQDLLPGDYL